MKIRIQKIFSLISVLFTIVSILSCASGDQDNKLAITMTRTKAYLIDATTRSCVNVKSNVTTSDVVGKYFVVKGNAISWSDTSAAAYIAYVKVTINSSSLSGGKYEKVLTTEEMGALTGNIACPWDHLGRSSCSAYDSDYQGAGYIKAAINSTTPSTHSFDCEFRFGGVSLASGVTTATMMGMIDFVGYSVDNSSGEQKPIKISTPITVEVIQ